jgi:hypothetical protein
LVFLFLLRFFHAGNFTHKRNIKFFDGGGVDFVFVEFFSLVKGRVNFFVIKVLEFLFVSLGFEFVFGVPLVISKLWSLSQGTARGLHGLLFNLLNNGMVD